MLILDAEWTSSGDLIHCVGVLNTENSNYSVFDDRYALRHYLEEHPVQCIVGHYLIFADVPQLSKLWGIDFNDRRLIDTWTLSTLLGKTSKHGLADWGEILGFPKLDFVDFDGPGEGESAIEWKTRMHTYLERDVRLTEMLYRHLVGQLNSYGFSASCVEQELEVARIAQRQMENGFYFDIDKACPLYTTLQAKSNAVKEQLQQMFPPIIEERIGKRGKRLSDKITVFNPGSRQQIAARLISAGVKLKQTTDKGAFKISDEVLEGIDHPAAKLVHEYLMLEKRISQMNQWFYYYNSDTGRIHGRVNPIGTNTHRQSQSSPNMAQIPSVRVPYGKECRALFTVPDGCKLVGVDASSLELRLLANRLQDPTYKELVETGDVHTYNMQQAGLSNRDQAKTFIYAFIYGASNRKLGEILGVSEVEAADITRRFLKNMPAFADFKQKIVMEAQKTGSITLLDGSKVWIESLHSALNYQLQGDGAVVMKRALCNFNRSMIDSENINAKLVVQAHDEWQIETPFWNADIVGELGVKAIEKVTSDYSMYVKLTGEYKVGTNWAETH